MPDDLAAKGGRPTKEGGRTAAAQLQPRGACNPPSSIASLTGRSSGRHEMKKFETRGDLDRMLEGIETLAHPAWPGARFRPECHPERVNQPLVAAMADLGAAALAGAPDGELIARRDHLLECRAAAKHMRMWFDFLDEPIERLLRQVDGVLAARREAGFTEAATALKQSVDELPDHPTEGMVSAGMRAGARSRKMAIRIFSAMRAAIGSSA